MTRKLTSIQDAVVAARPLPAWWMACALLAAIIVIQAIVFASGTALVGTYGNDNDDSGSLSNWLAAYSILKESIALVALLIILRLARIDTIPALRLRRISGSQMSLSCILILCVLPWDMLLSQHCGAGHRIVAGNPVDLSVAAIVSGLSLVFLTPVAEELVFRGFALSAFGKRTALAGIAGSSALFAIYHSSGSVASLAVPLPFAVVTAYATVSTRSIVPAIIAHALWNLLAFAGECGYTFVESTPDILIGSTVVAVICGGLLLRGQAKLVD